MALTKASYAMIDSAPFSVLDYGAVGDGVTNDSAAVQAAINAVSAAGRGAIVFPAGKTYFLNSQITLCNNLTVMGYGAKILMGRAFAAINTGLFKNFSGTNYVTPGSAVATSNVSFYGLEFDGGDAGVPNASVPNADMHGQFILIGGWTDGSGINGLNVQDCYFHDLEGSGVMCWKSSNINISNCKFVNHFSNETLAVGSGIQFQQVTGAVVSGNIFDHISSGYSWHGMVALDWTTKSKDIVISNNVFQNMNQGDGMSFEGNVAPAGNLENVVVSNNVIRNCDGDGISADHCIDVVISGNTIQDVGGVGILLSQTDTVVISGNNLLSMGGPGLWANGFVGRAIVSNNRIQDTGYLDANYAGQGIFFYNASPGAVNSVEIIGNYLKDIDGVGIDCNLTNSIIQGNMVYNFSRSASDSGYGIKATGMVCDNIVIGLSGFASYGINIEDGTTVKNNRVSGTFVDGFYRIGFRNSVYSGSFISPNNLNYDDNTKKIVYWASASPSATGTVWLVGDIVYNTAPTAGGTIGWVCTTQGNPGTWKTWGSIAA